MTNNIINQNLIYFTFIKERTKNGHTPFLMEFEGTRKGLQQQQQSLLTHSSNYYENNVIYYTYLRGVQEN